MRVIFRGAPLDLDDTMLLGEGGEARVYACSAATPCPAAFKIFHDNAPPKVATLRLQKLRNFPSTPANVVAPLELVFDAKNNVIGYAMSRVRDAIDIARLAQRSRLGVIDNTQVLK